MFCFVNATKSLWILLLNPSAVCNPNFLSIVSGFDQGLCPSFACS